MTITLTYTLLLAAVYGVRKIMIIRGMRSNMSKA
jgi:hypothetical protein